MTTVRASGIVGYAILTPKLSVSGVVGYALLTPYTFRSDITFDWELEVGAEGFESQVTLDWELEPSPDPIESDITLDWELADLPLQSSITFDWGASNLAPSRVTQVPMLAVTLANYPARLTQVPMLVVAVPLYGSRVTQVPISVINEVKPNPLPYPLIPEVPVTETWEWKTSIVKSIEGFEQRMIVREQPRVGMQFDVIILDDYERMNAYQTLYHYINKPMEFPLYQYSTNVTAATEPTDSSISFDPTKTPIQPGGRLALSDPHTGLVSLHTVASLSGSGAALDAPVGRAAGLTWHVCPAATFRIVGMPSIRSRSIDASIRLILETVEPLPLRRHGDTTALTLVNGIPVLLRRPLADGRVDERFNQNVDWLDNESGNPEPFHYWRMPEITGERTYNVRRSSDMDFWRTFFNAVRGQARKFYIPTYRDDLPIKVQPASGGNTFVTYNHRYSEYWRNDSYRFVYLELSNGTSVVRVVASALNNYDGDGIATETTVELTANLPAGTAIRKASFLNIARLSGDTVTVRHFELDSEITFRFNTVNQ